ncbi:MAG: helix-turn-helix domain-containing protein [Pseudomonadota bacterium]
MRQRILIIDDQPESASLLLACLGGRDVDIMVALDGADGLHKVVAGRPELILLDVAKPELDAFEVCRRLKQGVQHADIPIIFLSADTAIEQKLQAFALGCVDYITKPFIEDELIARVFVHLAMRQRMCQLEALGNQWAIKGKPSIDRNGDLYHQALEILNQNLANPPGLIELAHRLGTNERKLTDIFRNRLGMTVFEYLAELRLDRARHLLEASLLQIQHIASDVGFNNSGDFARAFRRRYQDSPSEYRHARRRSDQC